MAELLVKATDATHSDPEKDARGCYKQGDVVLVRDNGHPWGRKELLAPADGGKFVVIKITDVTTQQIRNWVRNHWNCDIEGLDFGDDGETPERRRRVRIDIDIVPNPVKQTLNQTGQYSTTWQQIRNFVRNKRTNTAATGEPI